MVELQGWARADPDRHRLPSNRPLEHRLADWQVDVRVDGYHRLPLDGCEGTRDEVDGESEHESASERVK